MIKKVGFSVLSCVLGLVSFAQEDTANAKSLEEVVITGQYKPSSIKGSVYQVKTITKERIQQQGATKLQDVLGTELNIRFGQDLATGGSDITMMGLSGANVKILIDGLPMVGRQGTSNEININQIDINSIERIEIVEGPMSVVYGADALAGVINIITKQGAKNTWDVSARIHEESVGKEYGVKQGIHNQYISLGWNKKEWQIGGSFGHNYFGGWKDTAIGRELIWHKKDQFVGNGYVVYTKGRFNAKYRFDGLDELITNPGNFATSPDPTSGKYLASDQEYLTQRTMHQLQAGYKLNEKLNFQLQSSYTDFSRQVYATTVDKETGDVRQDLNPSRNTLVEFSGYTVRAAATYNVSENVSLQPGIDINGESGEGERLANGKNSINDFAFFVSSEINATSKIKIRPGIRIIKNSVYDAPPVVPSLNAKIDLPYNLILRASYARGFRAPTLRELYFDFFDASHQIIGNTHLKAETSNSFNASLSWEKISPSKVVYTTKLGGYYNLIDDMIDYAATVADPNVFQLINIYKSKTAGVSLSSIAKYKNWNVTVGGSYTGFYNSYAENSKDLPDMMWSPELNVNAGYAFSKIGLGVNVFYKVTGKRPYYMLGNNNDYLLAKQSSYQLTDISLTQKVGKYVTINAGVRNLFDVVRLTNSVVQLGIHGSAGTNIATGRSFFAGLNFN